MEHISGYARVLARVRTQQEASKPLLGKPYLRYGQCYGLWSYFFQLGGILGARHTANLDAFGPAFLGINGPAGAVHRFFTEVAKRIVGELAEPMTFHDYVSFEFTRRVGYAGDARTYFLRHATKKLVASTAEELGWQYSQQGAALGAVWPQVVRAIYAETHAPVPDSEWQQARRAGLGLPAEQDAMSFDEAVGGENQAFMLYCRECCPDLLVLLKS